MKNSMFMLLAIALCSCAQTAEKESAALSASTVSPDQVQTLSSSTLEDPLARMIKTADYRFRVSSVKKSTEAIEGYVRKFPAHISGSNLTMEGNTLENRIDIRVKSEFFSDLLREIDKEASHVHHRNIRTEDVGKQFVDLESRLKTKLEVQERYKVILRTKAGKIEELLAAEKQIGDLQEEIEATVSRLNYLKDKVAYSTINLEFYENVVNDNLASTEDPTWKKFGDAFLSGLKGTMEILLAFTRIWPLLVLAGITAFIYWKKKKVSEGKV